MLVESFSLLVLIYQSESAKIWWKPDCTMGEFKGICVDIKECPLALTQTDGDFVSYDTLYEIQRRVAACNVFGRIKFCCDEKTITRTKPIQAQASARFTTLKTQTRHETETTKAPETITERQEITTHAPMTQSSTYSTTFALPSSTTITVSTTPTPSKYKMFEDLKCGLSVPNKISGGKDAELLEFPWATRIGYKPPLDQEIYYDCGGSLISDSFVITAAHCISFLPSNRILDHVRLGEYNLDERIDCDDEDPDDPICAGPVQDINIATALHHHEYNRSSFTNDIGIIKLAEKAKIKQNNIRPICLPITEELKEIPNNLIVTGWGKTDTQSESKLLQKAKVPLFDHYSCYQLYKNSDKLHKRFSLTERQFCAGGEGKTDACKGDSGNAIQSVGLFNGRPRMVQYGIVSYGTHSCGAEEGYPGIYVEVSKYLPWILDNAINL